MPKTTIEEEIIKSWNAWIELEKLEKYINNNKDVFERLKNK